MRLSILDHGHRRRTKLFLTLTSAMSRVDSPDIVKMLLYRPGFVTGALLELTADTMRGTSYWTPGECEFLAMCTSQLFQCPYCVDSHAELTRIASHGEIDPDDPDSTRPELGAVRAFLATVTLTPDQVDATGVTGVPECAVLEALRVNLVFNIIARLANAFGFTLRAGQLHSGTRALHRYSYRFPRFLLADGKTIRHSDAAENLRQAVQDAPATIDPALRAAAVIGDRLPEPWQSYATAVRDASHKITGTDIDHLTSAGHTEEEIFEVTVAAAVGAALHGFDAGRRALEHRTTG